MIQAVKTIIGGLCGFVAGAFLWSLFITLVSVTLTWAYDDVSIGSVVGYLLVFLIIPVSLFTTILGGVACLNAPRLFAWTFLPIAIFGVAHQATLMSLRSLDQPRDFAVAVEGTSGEDFAGWAVVDGRRQDLNGTIPARFDFRGSVIEMAVALTPEGGYPAEDNPLGGDRNLSLAVSIDGRESRSNMEVQTGTRLQLHARGYSETFGGTDSHESRLTADEAREVAAGNRPGTFSDYAP